MNVFLSNYLKTTPLIEHIFNWKRQKIRTAHWIDLKIIFYTYIFQFSDSKRSEEYIDFTILFFFCTFMYTRFWIEILL